MHESLQDYSESSPSLSSSSVSSDQKWVWLWPITYLFNIIGDCKARQLCRDSYKFVLTPIQTVKIPQTRQDSFTMSFWELRHWFAATTQSAMSVLDAVGICEAVWALCAWPTTYSSHTPWMYIRMSWKACSGIHGETESWLCSHLGSCGWIRAFTFRCIGHFWMGRFIISHFKDPLRQIIFQVFTVW